jgi:hypothetical protein
MFPTWRLRLREARLAVEHGRYDEAGRMLTRASLRDFLPAKRLSQIVAGRMVERASEQFARGDSVAGWRDLATADRLGGADDAIGRLRRHYAENALNEARKDLVAGQPDAALARLAKSERHGLLGAESRRCQQFARLICQSNQFAERGYFSAAGAAIAQSKRLVDGGGLGTATMELSKLLDEQAQKFANLGSECQRLLAEMHAALERESWGSALGAAEAVLAIAPQHLVAAQTRRRAWKAVGMDVTRIDLGRRAPRPVSLRFDGRVGRPSTHASARSSEDDTVTGPDQPRRALLWIDAVGGFLVCLDECVVLGQPSPGDHSVGGARIAVPILADLSRRHAAIRREGGAYVLDPFHSVRVDGRPIDAPCVLAENQLIQLGENVKLRFTKPHALSATARLVFESHHKTQPSADAVLLMADSCVLGPNRHCHVRCHDWRHDVVVYRLNDGVYCRSDRPLTIDGIAACEASEIKSGQRIEGDEFSFTWEMVA